MAAAPGAAADRKPPRIVGAQMIDADVDGKADRIRLTYSERIRHALDKSRFPFTVVGYTVTRANKAKGKTLVILIAEKAAPDPTAAPAVRYKRTTKQPVRDRAGNQAAKQTFKATLAFGVAPAQTPQPQPPTPGPADVPAMASLLINEVNPNIASSRDLIELLVASAGATEGITITQTATTTDVLVTLPSLPVAEGDLIVIHLAPSDLETTETMAKTECIALSCYATAWDIRGGTAGLAFSHRVVAVRSPGGATQDVVAFVNSVLGSTPGTGYLSALQAVQATGDWLPSNCGGTPCTYTSVPTALEVSVDWKDAGTTSLTSIRRGPGLDTNANADWAFAPASSFGLAN